MGAEITDANGTQTIEYAYDADGVRVAKTVDGDETRYLIDANRQYAQVLEEYDASTGTEVAYVYGNELISQARDGVESVYLYDGHSGTRQLTDETGAVTDSYLYDAYGNVLKRMGDTENSYLYRGEQSDGETGLQYLRARYNDLGTGRFISTDPFEGLTEMPMSRHRYLYGNNNPVMYIDPSGEIASLGEQQAALSISSILGGIAAALGTGYLAQVYTAYNAPSETEWTGTLLARPIPDAVPLPDIPIGIGLSSFAAGFVRAETAGHSGTWFIIGASIGTSIGGVGYGTPPFSGTTKITSPLLVGVGPQTLFGEFTLAGFAATGVLGGVYSIGFGRGTFANLDPTGNANLTGAGGIFGFSIPKDYVIPNLSGRPNLPSS